MTKKEKILIGIFAMLALVCFIAYSLIVQYLLGQQTILIYPDGNLSDSLFVSQNNTYTQSDALPNKTAFNGVPYYVDIPNGTIANVGEGRIVQVNDSVYIYISEFSAGKDAESVILDEFPSALLIDYDPLYTYSQQLKSQTGYINGFAAKYMFDMISVSNGSVVKTAYVAFYDLASADDEALNHILVGVVTTSADTASFVNVKMVLDTVTLTVRYDSFLESEQRKQEKLQKDEDIQKPEEESKPEEDLSSDDKTIKEESTKVRSYKDLITEDDYDARVTPIPITKTYGDMFINIVTDRRIEDSEITLYSPSFEIVGEKVVSEDGLTTQFQLGEITEDMFGDYVLKVTNYGEYSKLSVQVGDATE